jgi:hypothetical protein
LHNTKDNIAPTFIAAMAPTTTAAVSATKSASNSTPTSINANCSTSTLPSSFPEIPSNLNYELIPGSNASDPWMTTCCSRFGGHPVNVLDGCYEWCEVTLGNLSTQGIQQEFQGCIGFQSPPPYAYSLNYFHAATSGAAMLAMGLGGSAFAGGVAVAMGLALVVVL